MKYKLSHSLLIGLSSILLANMSFASVSLDRTRIIFDGNQKSVTLNINNNNPELPYLAQGWLENQTGEKITKPLVALPPIQRLEPGKSSQIKIESMPTIKELPQDRESLFYFNLREMPPKSDKDNVLQIALQTRIKLFYRPAAIVPKDDEKPWQEKITLEKSGHEVIVKNPTAYYVTILNAFSGTLKTDPNDFAPVMIAPFGSEKLGVNSSALGNKPVLIYINDYGGRPELHFNCQDMSCQVEKQTP